MLLDLQGSISLPRSNILIIRNRVCCYGLNEGLEFAPMIDPIPCMLSGHKGLNFITTTTTGSRVKLPDRNFYDYICRCIALGEKAIRKLFGLPRSFLYSEMYYWKLFLIRHKVSRVLCIGPSQSFLKVCKDFSIEVCEVQHGVVDVGDPESLSYKHMTESDLYPDFFLAWDQRSGDNALKRSFNKTNPIIGCSMALYHYLGCGPLTKSERPESSLQSTSKKINVLVTLQWGMGLTGPDHYTELQLEDAFLPRELLEYMVSSCENYNYIFRLHPVSKVMRGEVKSIFNSLRSFGLAKSMDELARVSKIPIYKQLQDVELHVTLYSSSTIEAAYVGVPTILLDPVLNKGRAREKHFDKEIADGIAFIADIGDLEASFEKALRMKYSSIEPIEARFKLCEQSLKKFLVRV
jgi:hypothetical protein